MSIARPVVTTSLLFLCTVARGQCETAILSNDQPGLLNYCAIHDHTLVVGDTVASDSKGRVYVFNQSGLDWELVQVLESPADSSSLFGASIDIVADVLVIGAPGNANPTVFVFRNINGSWTYEATLQPRELTPGFGGDVDTDGSAVIVGARFDATLGPPAHGSAYVYVEQDGKWIEQGYLHDPTPDGFDVFGNAVSISGDLALVGAHGNEDADVGPEPGAAYVFRRVGEEWQFEQQLFAPDAGPGDRFGQEVALVGDQAIVGSPLDNDLGNNSGSAYVFKSNGLVWLVEQKLLAPDGDGSDNFGLFIHGDTGQGRLLVAAPFDEEAGGNAGAVYLWSYSDGVWGEATKLIGSLVDGADQFGSSVFVAGDTALAAAPRHSEVPGLVYVFRGIIPTDCNENGLADACEVLDGTAPDYNGTGTPDECDADLDGDGSVGGSDLGILLAAWGTCAPECSADLNGDATIDGVDLGILLAHWG